MNNFFDYSALYIDSENVIFSGLSEVPNFVAYDDVYKEYKILPEEEYRPDKISLTLWENENLSWILDELNGFTHGIADYTRGRIINYIDTKYLVDIGIL